VLEHGVGGPGPNVELDGVTGWPAGGAREHEQVGDTGVGGECLDEVMGPVGRADQAYMKGAVPITPPARPTPTLAANCPSWLPGPLRVLATTPWNTSAPRIPPTGSISDPSQIRICCTRSVGRTKLSNGPTTVGPETTRMIPSISAAPRDIPRSGAATEAASAVVTRTPSTIRRITTLRVWPLSFRISRLRPAS
jgi:hypothetical protein